MTVITTPRFTLRAIREDDAPILAQLCNDNAIARNTARIPHPYTLTDARSFVKSISAALAAGTEYAFAVCERGAIVSCAGVMPRQAGAVELGYWVAAQARGKGVATEAAGATALFAFERLGAEPMLAGHFTDNPGSGRVLAKLGFKPTGEIVKTFSAGRGGEADTVRVTLTREDFVAPEGVAFRP